MNPEVRDPLVRPSEVSKRTEVSQEQAHARVPSQQGRNVVAGPYVYSLVFGMTVSDVSGKAIANLATEELSHPNPVFHGDTLFAESEVLEVRPSSSKPDRGVVKVHTRAYNQEGTLVAEFKRTVLVARDPEASGDEPAGAEGNVD